MSDSANSATPNLRLRISGMHCAACSATVQRAIESDPGVTSASVSVVNGTATVSGSNLDQDAIMERIRERGYDAEAIQTGAAGAGEMLSDIERRQQHHERMWRYRAVVGLSLWAPLELLHWFGPEAWHVWMPWAMWIGSTIVIAFAGWGFYRSAIRAALRRTSNMDTLIAVGATTAYIFSAIRLFGGYGPPMYFAEAAGLLGIVSLGHWFEARASAKAGSAVRDLLELQPETAERMDDDGGTVEIPSADIAERDRLLVRPGGRIPVDGIIVDGQSAVDESIVTGESIPIEKAPGDSVIAGSMNTTGRLVVEAEVDGRHTTISRIAEMVQEAQSSKADIQRLADTISSIFVPTVLSIAVVTLFAWWLLADDLATGVISAVTVLIISCPCALGLATPMAVMVGTGEASKRGILIKSADTLERIGRIETVVLDKTGTLTTGEAAVTSIEPANAAFDRNELLRLAASVEAPSEHPIARAIVVEAQRKNIELADVEEFEAIPGRGVRGVVEGHRIEVTRDDAATCQVIIDDEPAGAIMLADTTRSDAREAISALHELGVTVKMLSGDKESVAVEVGAELGLSLENIIADARPETKADHITALEKPAMMVGDGINDAAALAAAYVGVAMSSGTNVAIESADVVIPGDRVMAIPELITLSRQTLRAIKQNLFFAFVYNAAAIPVAALGLLGTSGPLWAALAMGASDITVIGNAIRLKMRLTRQSRPGPR